MTLGFLPFCLLFSLRPACRYLKILRRNRSLTSLLQIETKTSYFNHDGTSVGSLGTITLTYQPILSYLGIEDSCPSGISPCGKILNRQLSHACYHTYDMTDFFLIYCIYPNLCAVPHGRLATGGSDRVSPIICIPSSMIGTAKRQLPPKFTSHSLKLVLGMGSQLKLYKYIHCKQPTFNHEDPCERCKHNPGPGADRKTRPAQDRGHL